MRERGAVIVGALVLLLALLPLGALIHVSPRFPGSLAGSFIGIVAALLLLVSSAYALAKRVPAIHGRMTRHIGARTLLALHVYFGAFGAILGLVHAAHKLDSPIGISLTGIMILAVLSGYAARYLLAQVTRALRGRLSELAVLKKKLVSATPVEGSTVPAAPRGLWKGFFEPDSPASPSTPEALAGAIADTEYAIRSEEASKQLFGAALNAHIALAIILLVLLALHVWVALYYGLRWL